MKMMCHWLLCPLVFVKSGKRKKVGISCHEKSFQFHFLLAKETTLDECLRKRLYNVCLGLCLLLGSNVPKQIAIISIVRFVSSMCLCGYVELMKLVGHTKEVVTFDRIRVIANGTSSCRDEKSCMCSVFTSFA